MKNLIVFKASWCKTCGPMVNVIQGANLEIPISTIDIDEDIESTIQYTVRGVPTLLLMEDNQVVKRHSGSMTQKELLEFIK